ncbi:TIGR00289 family protein [Candidatus Woesearchaeota archaeon]|nr:TIGR00289 family protein [Candidatus Woesearchaeota archaeon]
MKIAALVSGGKDSLFAAYKAGREHELVSLLSVKSENPHSYMFHTPNIDLVELQAHAIGIPLVVRKTKGEKEKELKDLKQIIQKAGQEYKIQGIVTGALFSQYQKQRIDNICRELNLKSLAPLWRMDPEQEMKELIKNNFKIIFSSIAAYGFDSSWLGRTITGKDIDRLVELNKKYRINIAGEGGEFESLVLDCPLFTKKLVIRDSKIIEEDKHTAKISIRKAELKKKTF